MLRIVLPALALGLAIGCTDSNGDTDDTDIVDTDTGSDFYAGPWQISTFDFACDDGGTPISDTTPNSTTAATSDHNDDEWSYDVRTDGLAGAIEVRIFNSGNWDGTGSTADVYEETHFFDNNTGFDADSGTYDEWDLVLERTNSYDNGNGYTPAAPCAEGQTTGCTTPGAGADTATSFFSCAWDDATLEADTPNAGQVNWKDGSLAWMITMYDDSSPPVAEDCIIFGRRADQYFNGVEGKSCLCFEGDGTASYCQD